MAIINFLQHTIERMALESKSLEGVTFIGSSDGEYECSVENFKILADFSFDTRAFVQTVPEDLVITMSDGTWFFRNESGGNDWWEYNKLPVANANPKRMVKLQSSTHYLISLLHEEQA